MHLAVDDRHRREAAAAEAAHRLDGEEAVLRRRVEADAELALELLDEVVAAAQVACGAEADLSAISQVGRKITIDVDKALELANNGLHIA